MSKVIHFSLPIKTKNPLNGSQGFSRGAAMGAAKRRKDHRALARVVGAAHLSEAGVRGRKAMPCIVTVRRVAPSSGLDPHDGLGASVKGVIDGIADALGLTNDRDALVTWVLQQRRGRPGEYAVEVTIECQSNVST